MKTIKELEMGVKCLIRFWTEKSLMILFPIVRISISKNTHLTKERKSLMVHNTVKVNQNIEIQEMID